MSKNVLLNLFLRYSVVIIQIRKWNSDLQEITSSRIYWLVFDENINI